MSWQRTIRRASKVSIGAAGGALACVLVALGAIDFGALRGLALHTTQAQISLLLFACLAGLLIAAMIRRIQFESPAARAQRASFWLRVAVELADIELSLCMSAATYAVFAMTGGLTSPLYPLAYAIVAFAVTTMSRTGAVTIIGAMLFLEAASGLRAWQGQHLPSVDAAAAVGLHGMFYVGAAVAHTIMLRGLVARYRERRMRRLDEEVDTLRESARDYRLIAAALGPASRAPRGRDEEERLLAMGGVGMIADAAHWTLNTIKRSIGARTVALLWLDEDGDKVKLREVVSDSDEIVESAKLGSAGIFGAVIRDQAPLTCNATKPGQLPYYADDKGGLAAIAVPVLEGTHLRGILVADREEPFGATEKDLLTDAAAQLLRAVQSEQVFRAVERAKYEHERFYAASVMLGQALTPEQVMETTFDAARAIVEFEAAVFTMYDRDAKKHRVTAARVFDSGPAPILDVRDVDGLEFKDNAGLVSMVVKNRHYLPATGELRDVSVPVFHKKVDLAQVRSLLVLPLLSADEPIGTLTLFSRTEKRFGKDVREMLSVIANQVATSLQNGFLYRKMETMATTDGLTGLTNHRTFQQRFADLLDRADRHGYRVAMLLCDVDHFKKVNDNYGHPIGDEVLRRVARVLQDVPRKIDVPARYGGEEFAVLLDNVSAEQAKSVAERIRIEVGKLVIETEKGPLQVTQSIGVALFPDDGRDRAALIEHADLALYHAKHSGRNRVVTYQEFLATRGNTDKNAVAKKAS